MAETAQFNVGGQKYEVSRSLLTLYPKTMLAKSASDQWQTDRQKGKSSARQDHSSHTTDRATAVAPKDYNTT